MRYTIKVSATDRIIALEIWKPKYETIFNSNGQPTGTRTYYEIPKDLEEITEQVYNTLIQRIDLNYIKWINSTVVEEPILEKEQRETLELIVLENQRIEKLRQDLIRLSPYVVLTTAGNDLIENPQ